MLSPKTLEIKGLNELEMQKQHPKNHSTRAEFHFFG